MNVNLNIAILIFVLFSQEISTQKHNKNTTICVKEIGLDSVGLSRAYLMGQFDPSTDSRFVKITPPYSFQNTYMRKEAAEAFKKMQAAAQKEKISLKILSATRTFNAQRAVWEAKWLGHRKVNGKYLPKLSKLVGKDRALKILIWNAMPGTSRHHWGTDVDLNSINPDYWTKTAQGKKEYAWLAKNARQYGFCQVYSELKKGKRSTGYQEEKWHWSYMPVSEKLLHWYQKMVTEKDLTGFLGAETGSQIGIIKKYVLGINAECN